MYCSHLRNNYYMAANRQKKIRMYFSTNGVEEDRLHYKDFVGLERRKKLKKQGGRVELIGSKVERRNERRVRPDEREILIVF